MSLEIDPDLFEKYVTLPSGDPERFDRRWHLTGAGVDNVWDFGPMTLSAPSGRILLRGPNGTGKTTLLEALMTYLYDLDANQLRAGRNRTTTLSLLMGGTRADRKGKKQYGYAWLTFTSPGAEQTLSFGVRMQYSEKSSPAVVVYPFVVPGVPGRGHDLELTTSAGEALGLDTFREAVQRLGGTVWDRNEHDSYVAHLGNTVLDGASVEQVKAMTARLRIVRNPALLANTNHREAADALRAALPTVASQVIADTASALDASKATREAYELEQRNADDLVRFSDTWANRMSTVAAERARLARTAVSDLKRATRSLAEAKTKDKSARDAVEAAQREITNLEEHIAEDEARHSVLIASEAYKDSERIAGLAIQADSARRLAGAALTAARSAISTVNKQAARLIRQSNSAAAELTHAVASAQNADPHAAGANVTVGLTTAPIGDVGDATLDHISDVILDADPKTLREAADDWARRANQAEVDAERASLALTDFEDVETADATAGAAERDAAQLAAQADDAARHLSQAVKDTQAAQTALAANLREWAQDNVDLIAPHAEQAGWGTQDVDELTSMEPSAAHQQVAAWLTYSQTRAATLAAGLRARASGEDDARQRALDDADERDRQAQEFEDGKLTDLPRPAWADARPQDELLGAALTWAPDIIMSSDERDAVEWALGSAGVLGAHLIPDGAQAGSWTVRTDQPPVHPNLAAVLGVDPNHPQAATAAAVLERIGFDDLDTAGLVITRDGHFRSGPMVAAAPSPVPTAQFVGAHARRTAALARAAELRAEALHLRAQAATHASNARDLTGKARQVERRIEQAPTLTALVAAEARRAASASAHSALSARAHSRSLEAEQLREAATGALRLWVGRTEAAGLPASKPALVALRVSGESTARALRAAGQPIPRLLDTFTDLLTEAADAQERRREAVELIDEARTTHGEAHTCAIRHEQARSQIGIAADAARQEVQRLEQELRSLATKLTGARTTKAERDVQAGSATALLAAAEAKVTEAEPAVQKTMADVRAALAVAGVARAVLPTTRAGTDVDDDTLLAALETATQDRPQTSGVVLRNARDVARAALQGTWQIDNSEDHGVETYVVTFDSHPYTPHQAATLAMQRRERAQRAVNEQEREALETFVLGTLPKAISVAWTTMRDWVNDVNKMMARTTASSGVGVQIRVDIKDHDVLGDAVWTVYQLACRKSVHERTDQESETLRDALDQLIRSNDGATLEEQVLNAVDVRSWVSVHYVITRNNQEPTRWSNRIGVSTGEARLITLAPMVAAAAAAYDKLGPAAARVLVLDEVPAEVDPHGRGGLARYIAELDLDLVCTSFGWDGAPGATDGVDAWDLERASDGTVIETRSVLRGTELLNGDPDSWMLS
ncbi:hypothetical protein CTKZ_08400 [Cellulomonas algicola]|uniref:AAA+ ATPase domain-containing protein n=1 Tax=Cellulomonas algicola TaxID=2071633 RepID=A0A401UX98_9CELL|nr:SbcC/MukB-like Walker B domain-containing protein [Cellulomonas algicola]GCD19278.1 hypothetical protein CTKZ_08400 [Cellulomonas algicola]